MKRISFFLLLFALSVQCVRAQDAATEQRLNELAGKLEALMAGQESQRKQIDQLSREIRSLHDQQQAAPAVAYASQEDLKRVADAVEKVDRKRLDDYEKIKAELVKLGKTLSAPAPALAKKNSASEQAAAKPTKPEDGGFTYEVKAGDTLSLIVKGCREQNVKVTADQILKANPNLKPEKLKVGQKITIPAPQT